MRSCTIEVGDLKKWAVMDSYRFLKRFVKASGLNTSTQIKVRLQEYHCRQKKMVVKAARLCGISY